MARPPGGRGVGRLGRFLHASEHHCLSPSYSLVGLGLDVRGRTAAGDAGRVHVSYRLAIHGRSRTLHAAAAIRRAGFHAHLSIPPGARLLRGARIVVTYAGDGRHAPARVTQRAG